MTDSAKIEKQENSGALVPWTKASQEVAETLASDPKTGLSTQAATQKLAEVGPNRLADTKGVSPILLFIEQFKSPLLIILMIGAAISFYTQHYVDAVAIAVIVFLNALISFMQEFRAAQSLAALKEMSAPLAFVRRDGNWVEIPAADIVPGDLLRFKAGDIIAADVRFTEAARLAVDEAALTGESEPVDKHTLPIDDEKIVLADRLNMGFMSTKITNGTGEGIATGTGMATEVGHIAHLMATAEDPKTPLQIRIEKLSKVLIAAALGVVAIVIGIGIFQGMDVTEMLNTAISLSVAAIPEGLPTVVTIVLTLGSQRMVANNALARKLSSVETLGTTSVICSDKTGTLTQNQMQVMRTWAGGKTWDVSGEGFDPNGEFVDADGNVADIRKEFDLRQMLNISAYCNDAELITKDGRPAVQGNPTEGALVVAAAKVGLSRARLQERKVQTMEAFPFDSTRKMMSVHTKLPNGENFLIAKGAPDVILKRAKGVWLNGELHELTDEIRAQVEGVIEDFGGRALRTLAIAFRQTDDGAFDPEDPEQNIILIGIHGIMDPPRPEVRGAVEDATSAGIRTVMITGDHAVTAQAIAEQIGIKTRDDQTVHTGVELDAMSDEDLEGIVPNAAVFARVTPEHKLRIVKAMQNTGEVAAMTGDGVNDAPALRTADIGVAMGIAGTSVAKDSAALVLLDDNFSTIVKAVKEGRRIYDNLLKFVRQALTANVAEVSTILFAFMLMGADPLMPLTPLMILWVNLISDGIPALALGFEKADDDIMGRKPRAKDEDIFAGGLKERILVRGLAVGFVSYLAFKEGLSLGLSLETAQTMAFVTIMFAQLWHVFDARTNTTLFRKSPFGNPKLLMAVALSLALSAIAVFTPLGHFVLGTTSLSVYLLLGCAFVAALPTFLLSGAKEVFGWKWL
ncbi:Calcium-transporting ATPase [Shimia sp. SK013]|uniref:cation-translocating P-type ATPase n=1 Tax=Shimia sp. SK013 TaxID=1389006 RepID=UPI0006B681BE|nr:cation-translocating P-type ATPase [Shimia sp. SK013]KPA21393.1 Calcium-transporting ATPase [Shimia sp. SK013]